MFKFVRLTCHLLIFLALSSLSAEEFGRCNTLLCPPGEVKIGDEEGVHCFCAPKEVGEKLSKDQFDSVQFVLFFE